MITDHNIAHNLAHHPTGGARDLEAKLAKRPAEQTIHFVAPSATIAADDFLEDDRTLDRDRPAKLHIEVLI